MPHRRFGAAVIGVGFSGRMHATSIRRAGGTIVGVVGSSVESSQAAASALQAGDIFGTAEDLIIDPRVDVVHICTPNAAHAELARLAISAGKHVVCEKPLATSAEEAAALVGEAEHAGVFGAVPFVYPFHAMVREARTLALGGELGPVRVIHGSYLQDWMTGDAVGNWRVDAEAGGPSRAFADIGSHWCDLTEWISGHRVTEIVSSLQTTVPRRPPGRAHTFSAASSIERKAVSTEDVACLLFRTDLGALGTLTVSQVSPGRKNRLWFEIDGEERSMIFNQERPEQLSMGATSGVTLMVRDATRLSRDAAPYAFLPAGHAQGFQDCFDAFVHDAYRTIEKGELVAGVPTFADGLRAARLTDAVRASAMKRSWVEV